MDDLYTRLGVSSDATAGEIADACQSCANHRLHDAGAYVLLDEKRRVAYDRIHRQLSKIGQLRANLGLTHCEHWQAEFSDFDKVPTLQGSLLDRMERRHGSRRRQFLQKNWRYLVGVLWLTIFSCLVGYAIARFGSKQSPADAEARFEQPGFALPESGEMTKGSRGSARLSLQSSKYGANYVVKLKPEKGLPIVVFIRAGETASVDLPAGDYTITYAAGTEWYGSGHLFGPNTLCRRLRDEITLEDGKPKRIESLKLMDAIPLGMRDF